MTSGLIPLFVAIPLGSAFIISLLGKKLSWFPALWTALAMLSVLVLSILSVCLLGSEPVVYEVGGWDAPPLGIAMVLDGLTCFMLITVSLVSFLVAVYSINYMKMYTGTWKFYTLFLLMVAGMNGVVVTGDMFNLFVFLEIGSVASYALVAFGTEHEELEAAFKYMVMGVLTSLFILLGIALLYSYTSTLNMADMSRIVAEKGRGPVVMFAGVLFLVGFGLKAALVPFHAWLPDAHPSAPAPISAMLSGVVIKTLGVYALLRVIFGVLGLGEVESVLAILRALGAVSMVVGALLAIGQRDMKRMLAYSSISQVGYIVLAIGLGTYWGFLGALFYLLCHAVFKSLLFLNSGAVVYSTGTRDLEQMGGLGRRMPVTGATSMVASMSIAGIPPFAGFFSKLIIIMAAVKADQITLAIIAVVVSIITLSYYLKMQRMAFLGKLADAWKEIREAPSLMCVSMVVLAVLCLALVVVLLPSVRAVLLDPAVKVLEIAPNVK